MPPLKKMQSKYTEEELLEMSREEIIDGLQDREVAFCEYYIQDYNTKLAAIKAGYNVSSSRHIGVRIKQKPRVNDYICWLKVRLYQKACVYAVDVLNQYAKLAFFDVTDYVEKAGNKIKLKDFEMIDGQVIQEISQNSAGGINVKFPDRIKALEKLENFLDPSPLDWKRNIEERKMKILEERLVIEKQKVGLGDEIEDDGFMQALESIATQIFVEEGNEEEA